MPQPWVVSDFDDCEIVAASFPNSKRKATGGTKRPLSSLSQDFNEKASLSAREIKPEVPWSIKYSPKTTSDLVVAKAKVSELTTALENLFEPRIILLTGPPGCGKSVTVRCVANSLGLKVREWIQPISETRSYIDFAGNFGEQFDNGILRTFSDFLLNSTAYESLTALSSAPSPSSAVVTVIEEMPSFKSENCPETMFHDLLKHCAASLHSSICFILTSNAANADPPELHRLFPQRLRDELQIYCLSLNPIPTRTMAKMLTTVATSEKVTQILPANCINDIVETSDGDLRAAVNSLQFLSQKVKSRFSDSSSVSKRGPKERKLTASSKAGSGSKFATPISNDGRSFSLENFLQSDLDTKAPHDSHSLLLFRALGRVLHCKRAPLETDSKQRMALPDHLKHFEADALTFDPVALFRHCPVSPSTFVGFLNHNSPAFYSSIDDLATLNERYLTICDLIFNQWDSQFENNSELAGLLAVFATVNCNSVRRRFAEKDPDDLQSQSTSQYQKYGGGGGGAHSSFKPLHAPPVWNTRRCASDRQKAARTVLPNYLTASSDEVIADYVSFARITRNYHNVGPNRGWLRELSLLGEVGRTQVRPTALSASASYDESSAVENQNYFRPLEQHKDSSINNMAMSNEDTNECRAYNDLFLKTIQEDDD